MAGAYNGFTWAERKKTAKDYYEDLRTGRRKKHTVCMGCTTRRAKITGHSEDYSEPYGDHVGAFGFCHACHTMLHLREQCDTEWNQYRESLRKGYRWTVKTWGLVAVQPVLRDLRAGRTQTLFPEGFTFSVGMLDLVDSGVFDPRKPTGLPRAVDPLSVLAEYCDYHPLVTNRR